MDGAAHTKATLLLTGGFLLATVVTQDVNGLLYAAGSLTGVLVQPDCDVDAGNVANQYLRRKSRGLEALWNALWWCYRRSLKHGMELSHFYVLGTLGRVLYLYFFLIVLPHALYYLYSPTFDLWQTLTRYWQGIDYRVVLGLMGADAIHYTLDLLTTNNRLSL